MEFEHFDPREQTLADVPKIATLRELRDELAACKARADREAAAAYDTAEFLLEAYMIQKANRYRLAREGRPSERYYYIKAASRLLAVVAGAAIVLGYQSVDVPSRLDGFGELIGASLDVMFSIPVVVAVVLIIASAILDGIATAGHRHELLETIGLTAGDGTTREGPG